MAQFYTLLTAIGQAKLANALALGEQVTISHLAVGDGNGNTPTPDSDRTALVNEVRRAQINRREIDPDNPNWIVVEQILPPDVGGWTIREIGVFDEEGDLIAYGNYPTTYKPTLDEGSGRTQTVRMVLQVSDTAAVTLRVDPSVVLATRKYVDDQRKSHEESREHPGATESAQGMIQRATSAQALAGSDNTRAMTPSRVHEAFGQFGLGGRLRAVKTLKREGAETPSWNRLGVQSGSHIANTTLLVNVRRYDAESSESVPFIVVLQNASTGVAVGRVYALAESADARFYVSGTELWVELPNSFTRATVTVLGAATNGSFVADTTESFTAPPNSPQQLSVVTHLSQEHRTENGAHAANRITLASAVIQAPAAGTVQQALSALGAFSGDGYQNIAIFDTVGVTEWTVPDVLKQGLRKAHVTAVGGGGGGRHDFDYTGGGGGGTAIGLYDLNGIASVPVTVGAGGTGGAGSTVSGGSSSSFGSYCTAHGGSAGYSIDGGDGGSATGGSINVTGGDGGSGRDAGPRQSFGGASTLSGSSKNLGAAGRPGRLYGGGGAGGTTEAGNGARGIVIVRW